MKRLQAAQESLANCRNVVFFGGAGADSFGIPFRSATSLYNQQTGSVTRQ